jgi:hypothetical protein
MNAKLTALFAFALGATIGLVVGCQRYDFEPVSPVGLSQTSSSYSIVAKKLKPDVMLMVDNSGSMYLPINPSLTTCKLTDGGGCGQDYTDPSSYCGPSCPTRTSELKRAMGGFFADAGTVARFGLTTFPYPVPPPRGPYDSECSTGAVRVPISLANPTQDVDADLQAAGNQIASTIGSDIVGGGTPTGNTVAMLGNDPGLQPQPGRDAFILLETDGVPNCNANNVNDGCNNPVACACTIGTLCCGGSTPYRRLGCLDQAATVNAIANLQTTKKIKTIVFGFGDEAAGSTPTLEAMAEAGGFVRGCPDGGNGPCGANNTCVQATKLCLRQYYQANNGDELAQALRDAVQVIPNPCKFSLSDTPSNPSLLAVIVDGQSVAPGPDTWSYNPPSGEPPYVLFTGNICTRLTNATAAAPVHVDIRIVRTL